MSTVLQTRELAPFQRAAGITNVNLERRTVEVIFSTGAAVERVDSFTGQRYLEKLSLEPGHIDLSRLNSGAPVLDSHVAYHMGDILGVVERASLEGGRAVATLRFSQRATDVWMDVVDRILTAVSVGYRVAKYVEEAGKGGALAVRTAINWTPYEISMVSMAADVGAKVRSGRGDMNPCEIVRVNPSSPVWTAIDDAARIARFERLKAVEW